MLEMFLLIHVLNMFNQNNQTNICYITVSLFFLSISSVWAKFHCDILFLFFLFKCGEGCNPHITPLPPLDPPIGYDTRNTESIIIIREKQ